MGARGPNHPINVSYPRHHPVKVVNSSEQNRARRSSPESRGRASLLGKVDSRELEGVVLTLASPGSDQGRL